MAPTDLTRWPNSLQNALRPIMGLMNDDAVTEIEVNGWNEVYAKGRDWNGHKFMEEVSWPSYQSLVVACASVAEISERVVNEVTPLFDGRLPTGERVNIAAPPCCAKVAMTIRKFPKEVMSLEKLLEYESINEAVLTMLTSLVLLKKNLLSSGGTESGKTSLLNALSRVIPTHERVITVEDARELQLVQRNWVALETLKPWMPGQKPIDISDLVVNTLRQSPDRIVVGEVRGAEALFLLRANSTGHSGGLATVHANSAPDALSQLMLLAQFANIGGANPGAIAQLVGRAIDVVIHVSKFEADGSRRVVEIIEVDRDNPVSMNAMGMIRFNYRTLLKFKVDHLGKTDGGRRKVYGHWEYPHRPSQEFIELLDFKGLDWPVESYGAPDPFPQEEAVGWR